MNISGSSKPHESVTTLHEKYEGRLCITNIGSRQVDNDHSSTNEFELHGRRHKMKAQTGGHENERTDLREMIKQMA